MQTFLPYPSFLESARCLDRQRLGKQRVEALQILRTIARLTNGWQNHPAVCMWCDHGLQLVQYGLTVCDEWILRNYRDSTRPKILALARHPEIRRGWTMPPWLGDPVFHASHRAALLAKDPEWYGRIGWKEEPKIDYVWPR